MMTQKQDNNNNINAVDKIKTALLHLNNTELDIEKLKKAVTVIQRRHNFHTHTSPQHRNNVGINIKNNKCKEYNNKNGVNNKNNNDKKYKSWLYLGWLYCIKLICRYLTFFFIAITIASIIIIAAVITAKNDDNTEIDTEYIDHQELTGLDTLRLLTQTVEQSIEQSMGSIFEILTGKKTKIEDNLKISIIQSIDSSTVFLKSSDDDKIKFIPFRKPKDSYCSQKEFSFDKDCVNVHNVRDVEFHAKNKELEFLISASYPRLIEIDETTTIILNDRLFGISSNGEKLEELTNNEYYEDGNKFCLNNILFIKDNNNLNRIIISGSCYGLLYLPQYIFSNNNNDELHLLSSKWSSIIIDTQINIQSLIIAANNEGSIIFRNKLIVSNLNLAITDNSYVEIKEIHHANYISMITLKGSQIFIPSIMKCKTIDFAARNHSMIEIENIQQTKDVHLSISHFSQIRIPHMIDTHLTFKREKHSQLLLPKPYNNIESEEQVLVF